jgi:glycosyltransferase involved in cell wall biosynthesis
MTSKSNQSIDYGVLVPSVGVFGGVRRFIEIGNELLKRGHGYTLYCPTGLAPDWIRFDGETRPLSALADTRHQVLICNDPYVVGDFERAGADLKLFYFALENIKDERRVARHPGWTILANSSGLRRYLMLRHGIRAERVVGGINLKTFTPRTVDRDDDDFFRILVFGRLSRRKKGVPIVVNAIESAARSLARSGDGRPVKLVLFDHLGEGNTKDPRKEFRSELPFEFHLNLSQPELAALYTTCDLFVSAEKRAGWANTVAESMACGVPVVCTRSGTKDLAVHRKTAWVAWRFSFFIRRGVVALYSDPALAATLRDNALERIERFSWPRVVDQLEAVVEKKLGSGR